VEQQEHLNLSLLDMHANEQGDEPTYEVGQEQLDAVDRMLEELDLDEQFDRGSHLASSCFRHCDGTALPSLTSNFFSLFFLSLFNISPSSIPDSGAL
jgi:hypothetical protein